MAKRRHYINTAADPSKFKTVKEDAVDNAISFNDTQALYENSAKDLHSLLQYIVKSGALIILQAILFFLLCNAFMYFLDLLQVTVMGV